MSKTSHTLSGFLILDPKFCGSMPDNNTDSPKWASTKRSTIVSDILSQEEIEALLSSLGPSSGAPAPAGAPAAATGPANVAPAGSSVAPSIQLSSRPRLGAIAYEVYDFRRPDKFSKEQIRTLQMLHETFARHAATALSAYLRCPVHVELISLEQVPYDEYLKGINNSVFTVMSLPPLTGQAILEMEFGIVFSLIDKLLGGPGRAINRTVLTDIEKPLVRNMVERVFSALKTSWEQVVVVSPAVEQMETTAQFVQIAPPNDIVVTFLFEVRIGTLRGAMSICIPYVLLKPITAKLSAQKWFVSGNKKSSPSYRKVLAWQVQNSVVECAVNLGRSKLNVRDFLNLHVGDVVKLDKQQTDDLTLTVGKNPKFIGKPATSGRRIVFTITQALSQERPSL